MSTVYMNLLLPTIGVTSGPDYANEINNALTVIDAHDHSSGKGNQIIPSSININSDLDFANNQAINLSGTNFQSQSVAPSHSTAWVNAAGDLWYTNAGGVDVQVTNGSSIAGAAGTITGLTSPASAALISTNFVWKVTASLYANLEFESAVFHNITNSNTVTLSSVAVPSSSYGLVLPTLPASTKIMALDASGNMSAPYVIDNSTLEINSNTIRIKDLGVTDAKIQSGGLNTTSIANQAVTAAKIANNTITSSQIANNTITGTQISTGASLSISDLTLSSSILQILGRRAIRNIASSSNMSTRSIFALVVSNNAVAVRGDTGTCSIAHPSTGVYDITITGTYTYTSISSANASPFYYNGSDNLNCFATAQVTGTNVIRVHILNTSGYVDNSFSLYIVGL